MDTVLILDTETTGLDPSTGQCIEVAIVRYSIQAHAVLDSVSWLLHAESNPAEHINHIPASILLDADSPAVVWPEVSGIAMSCDAVLAHNADFDRQWVESKELLAHPWIDTCHAVDWPMQSKPGSSLITLALDHGLAVVDPHRALSDCLLLARLLSRVAELGHDVSAILERGLRPTATFQALVTYDQRQAAKDAGFHWEAPKKQWLRKIEDAKLLPFRVANLDEGMLKGTL